MKKFLALMFAVLLVTASSVSAKDESFFDDYLEYDIDAENKIISTIGFGYSQKGVTLKDSFCKTYTRQAARLDALRNLAKEIQGVEIEVSTPIRGNKAITEEEIIKTHILSTVIKKAWQIGDAEFIEDGDQVVCRVKMATTFGK